MSHRCIHMYSSVHTRFVMERDTSIVDAVLVEQALLFQSSIVVLERILPGI